jgi:hypothetical protein
MERLASVVMVNGSPKTRLDASLSELNKELEVPARARSRT